MALDRLIIFRHGKAERSAASGGGDFDRALVDRGREDSAETARRLAEAGYVPELALVSQARRALETWEAARPAFPSTRLEVLRELYHAEAADYLRAAQRSGAASVMLVGHNPGLHALAFDLAAQGRTPSAQLTSLSRSYPTACAAVIAFEDHGSYCEALVAPARPSE